jgi:NAD(P)H-quinone oxidoreductase subunit 4
VPALALSLGVVALGLFPAVLGHLSEATTTAMAPLANLLAVIPTGGMG